mmetsp:Transcript_55139/g.124126  ORF Transcript_55139/g.124126 Transcript_55139/m.124126 type:complete len:134 (-) Transcript_55139:101-502(-)
MKQHSDVRPTLVALSLVIVGSSAAVLRAGSSAQQVPTPTPTPRFFSKPKGYDLCVGFVQARQDLGVSGTQLLEDVAGTCEPSVRNGHAMIPFKRACSEVQRVAATAISRAHGRPDPKVFCDTFMRAFHSYGPQ